MGNQRFSIVPARAVSDGDMPDSIFRTLCALGMFGDRNGWCYPSLRALAEIRGVSRSTISRHLRWLEEHGYLNITHQWGDDGSRKPSIIQIKFDYPPEGDPVALNVQQGVALKAEHPVALKDATLTPHINAPINGGETAPNGAGTTDEGAERDGAAGQTRPKRKRKARTLPEPIAVYRRWTHLYPPRSLWDELTTLITDTERWERVVKSWVASGWNPRNLSGMLEYYQRGEVPGTARSRKSHAQPERPAPRDAREVLKELGL